MKINGKKMDIAQFSDFACAMVTAFLQDGTLEVVLNPLEEMNLEMKTENRLCLAIIQLFQAKLLETHTKEYKTDKFEGTYNPHTLTFRLISPQKRVSPISPLESFFAPAFSKMKRFSLS